MRKKFNLVIGDRMAEEAKIAIGCAYPRKKLATFTLKGRHAMSGLPETTVMNSDEMIEALIEPAIAIVRTVQATLEETPPELLADIFTDGIYLTGGSANLYGFSTLLSKKTKIPVVTFDNPENCVVLGAGKAIKYIDKIDSRTHGKLNPLVAYTLNNSARKSPPELAPGDFSVWRLFRGLGEGLVQVGQDVVDVLDAHGEADEVGGHAGLLQLAHRSSAGGWCWPGGGSRCAGPPRG